MASLTACATSERGALTVLANTRASLPSVVITICSLLLILVVFVIACFVIIFVVAVPVFHRISIN